MPTISPPPPGIYVPTFSFFKDTTQEVDLETTEKHAVRLARAGVTGLVVHGTTGEPAHLTRAERSKVIAVTRNALDAEGYEDMPLIIGVGVSSTRETIELCKEAEALGGSFVIVIPPFYYKANMGDSALEKHYCRVADNSPLPVILYNYPAVANGIDLDFLLICKLAQHPNIVGIKLSCGNLAKGARLSATFSPAKFSVFGGLADGLLAGLVGGSQGVIMGLGNITPKAAIRVFELFQKCGDTARAKEEMRRLSLAGEIEIKGGVPAMRFALQHFFGYGGICRWPLLEPTEEVKVAAIRWCQALVQEEQ